MDKNIPTFFQAFCFWSKLGLISFGGPASQISIMHQEIVEKKKWVNEDRFFHALNYCMLLPGPEAQQLAIYIGWLLHGIKGGLTAGIMFVLPSAFILWGLSFLYVQGQDVEWVKILFYGFKPAVIAIVISAIFRIGTRVLKNKIMFGVSALAFFAISILNTPFPLIILLAAVIGWIGSKISKEKFLILKKHNTSFKIESKSSYNHFSTFKTALTCLFFWWTPVFLIVYIFGWQSIFAKQGLFFSSAAMVTFGGAYAVLPYVAQHAVERLHWLSTSQMIDGLGLAETTPGPLIMVLQFVGFISAWQNPPVGWSPIYAATLGALITTWVTFVPCFMWIFIGAPYIETLRENDKLNCALSSITAAVLGLMLNLAFWFIWHAIFDIHSQIDWSIIAISLFSIYLLQKYKINILYIILISVLLGFLSTTSHIQLIKFLSNS